MRIPQKLLFALATVCALGGVTATTALASGKPFVETKPVSNAKFLELTLNGVVNPNGAETKYYFEYGATISYGKTTAEAGAGAGTTNLEESKVITGLFVEHPQYHFRIVATNSNGTTYGADEIFGKPVTQTFQATATSETGATLNSTVNPSGVETKYYFEYGTEPGKLTSKTAETSAGSGTSTVEESQIITGLAKGTRYYYRAVASNGIGDANGSEKVFRAVSEPEFSVVAGKVAGTVGTMRFSIINNEWVYRHVAFTGEVASPYTVKNVTLSFREGGSGACNSASGELVWPGFVGTLGYIDKAEKEVGLLFEPTKQPFAHCEGSRAIEGKYEYGGTFVAQITPVGRKTSEYALNVSERVNAFEGEEAIPLELGGAGSWGCATESGREKCKFGSYRFPLTIGGEMSLTTAKTTEIIAR